MISGRRNFPRVQMSNVLLRLGTQVSDETFQDRRVSLRRSLAILNLLPLEPILQVLLNRGGLQGSLVSYRVNVRDGLSSTSLNKRALLPHVCSFLELHCDLQRVFLFDCTGATGGLAAIGQINDRLPVGRTRMSA